MATVKKGNVPPTHPTVWVGLGLSVVGLLLATYSYTGARVYDIAFAFVALGGALLALVGILTAAWGRSILSARASRARRVGIQKEALSLAATPQGSEEAPTIAAPREKKRLAFGFSKKKEAKPSAGGVFAFRRPAAAPTAPDDPRNPAVAAALEAGDERVDVTVRKDAEPALVRVTLRCPQCSATFTTEGTRPFDATCAACGFTATV